MADVTLFNRHSTLRLRLLSPEPLRFCCNPVTTTRGSGRLVFFV
jgi:hypothetical protein